MSKRRCLFLAARSFLLLALISVPFLIPLRTARAGPRIFYAAPVAQGNGDCFSWVNACSLKTALERAQSGDEIWVKAGVHKPTTDNDPNISFVLKSGVALYGGFVGTETFRDARDWVANPTVLSGDIDNNDQTDERGIVIRATDIVGTNSYHVIYAKDVTESAIVDGFVITAGKAAGSSPNPNGGGIYIHSGSPILRNLIFSGNATTEWLAGGGGGLYNLGGSPMLIGVRFNGNSAAYGGGMYNESGSPTLLDVAFSGNHALYNGGGLYNIGSSILGQVIFMNNDAPMGGGMYNSGDPTLINVLFSSNRANQSGGGMYNIQGDPTLVSVIFSSNSAGVSGGGIENIQGSPMLVSVTFSGNSATSGGGMNNNTFGNPTIVNAIFNNNSAANGGGISNVSGHPTLVNVTFTGNSATFGGGIYNYSSLNLGNAILWNNTAFIGSQVYDFNTRIFVSYSDIQGCGRSGRDWKPACGIDGGGNIDADPRFMDASGGNFRLRLDSPCIDAGNNLAVPAGITIDWDGRPRFVDIPEVRDTGKGSPPIVDMGAYEVQPLSYRLHLPLILRSAR